MSEDNEHHVPRLHFAVPTTGEDKHEKWTPTKEIHKPGVITRPPDCAGIGIHRTTEQMDAEEMLGQLMRIVITMPTSDQHLFELMGQEATVREIGQDFGCSAATAMRHQRAMRERLRAEMKQNTANSRGGDQRGTSEEKQ